LTKGSEVLRSSRPNDDLGRRRPRSVGTGPFEARRENRNREQNRRTTMAAAKTAIKEKYTKSQILGELSDKTGLSKKEVGGVLEELASLIERHIGKKSVGEFTLPGLLKITTVHKKAQKARKGINPFTGEETTFKAKPARTVVKVRPLKKLKEMVE